MKESEMEIDCYLRGIRTDDDRRMDEQLDVLLKGCKAVQDMCSRAEALEKRWDALCANAKAHVAPPEDPEPLAFTS
jgi:hypothetical protein